MGGCAVLDVGPYISHGGNNWNCIRKKEQKRVNLLLALPATIGNTTNSELFKWLLKSHFYNCSFDITA